MDFQALYYTLSCLLFLITNNITTWSFCMMESSKIVLKFFNGNLISFFTTNYHSLKHYTCIIQSKWLSFTGVWKSPGNLHHFGCKCHVRCIFFSFCFPFAYNRGTTEKRYFGEMKRLRREGGDPNLWKSGKKFTWIEQPETINKTNQHFKLRLHSYSLYLKTWRFKWEIDTHF